MCHCVEAGSERQCHYLGGDIKTQAAAVSCSVEHSAKKLADPETGIDNDPAILDCTFASASSLDCHCLASGPASSPASPAATPARRSRHQGVNARVGMQPRRQRRPLRRRLFARSHRSWWITSSPRRRPAALAPR